MDVEPERPFEQHRRDEEAVRAHDDDVRRDPDTVVEPCRLLDRNPQPLGRLLCGRRRDAPPAPRGLVGPRQQLDDLELRREPLEDVGAERRGRGDRDPPSHS